MDDPEPNPSLSRVGYSPDEQPEREDDRGEDREVEFHARDADGIDERVREEQPEPDAEARDDDERGGAARPRRVVFLVEVAG